MNDSSRAEITNGVWLCRNCHKLIDSDDQIYSNDLLYAWREQHEAYTFTELGSSTDKIQFEEKAADLDQFDGYPYIVRRIAIDRPKGWEHRLTAELMRHLNRPVFRRMKDLRDGLYVRQQVYLDADSVIPWIQERLTESTYLTNPISGLFVRLNESWGELGQPGNVDEIHHVTKLFRDYIEQVIEFEERIHFVHVPEKYKGLTDLLKDLLMSQVGQVSEVPDYLDDCVAKIDTDHGGTEENPTVITKTICLDVPKDWNKRFDREIKRIQGFNPLENGGCMILIVIAAIIFFIMILG